MARKKSKSGLIIIIFLIVIIGAIVSTFLLNKTEEVIKVTTTKVDRRTITQTVKAIGKIEPETKVAISSEVSGEIIELAFREGDTVKSGDMLIKIKPDIIETQLEQYEAAARASKMEIEVRKAELTRVESELKRNTDLYKKDFISQQDFDRVKTSYEQANSNYNASLARYEQALAGLKQIRRNAERTSIYSPIDGIVTKLDVEIGEKVVGTSQFQGTEMMVVSDLNEMNAVVEVDENDIVLVKKGDTTEIEIDAIPDVVYKGLVTEIGHSAKVNALGSQDQVTNFEVKIRLIENDDRLRPGMSCNVEIETETKYNVLAVPINAVTVRDTTLDSSPDLTETEGGPRKEEEEDELKKKDRPQSVVFIKENNKAMLREVEVGISDNGFIEITEGLSHGDEIISGPFRALSRQLKDKSEIKVDTNMTKRKFGSK